VTHQEFFVTFAYRSIPLNPLRKPVSALKFLLALSEVVVVKVLGSTSQTNAHSTRVCTPGVSPTFFQERGCVFAHFSWST
jgi:hypothetical protein